MASAVGDKENAGRRFAAKSSSAAATRGRFGRGVLHWGETAESLFLIEGLSGAARDERSTLAERIQQRPDDAAAWWALLEHVDVGQEGACRLYRRATQSIPKNRPELNESDAYISIWLGFAREQTRSGRRNDALDALRYMRNEGIGRRSPALYRAWASCEAGAGKVAAARDALAAGIRSVPAARRADLVDLAAKSDADLVRALANDNPRPTTTTTTRAPAAADSTAGSSARGDTTTGNLGDDEASTNRGPSLRREDIDYMLKWNPKPAAPAAAAPKQQQQQPRRVNFAPPGAGPEALFHAKRPPPSPPRGPTPAKHQHQVPQQRASSGSSNVEESSSDSDEGEKHPNHQFNNKSRRPERTPSSSTGEVADDETAVATALPTDRDSFMGLLAERNLVRVEGEAYARLALIGRGGSSKVFRVLDTEGRILALKRVRLRGPDARENLAGYANEITLLRRLRGKPGIITLHAAEIDEAAGSIHMIMEAGEADLATVLAQRRDQTGGAPPLSHVNFVRLAWQQMLEAVHTIHEDRIVHGDLKPANFLFVQGRLRLIDFGIARAIKNDTTNVYRDAQIGTLNFMSPEASTAIRDTNVVPKPPPPDSGASSSKHQQQQLPALRGRRKPTMRVGRASDVWSLGCILYQMVYGRTPFGHLHLYAKLQAICNPSHEIELPDAPLASDEALDCLRRCLQREPTARPPINGPGGLITHRFLEPKIEDTVPSKTRIKAALAHALAKTRTPCKDLAPLVDAVRDKLKALCGDDDDDLEIIEGPALVAAPPARKNRRRSIVDRVDRRMLPLAEELQEHGSSATRRGLEEFYDTRHHLRPNENPIYGRAWEASELRRKSFGDLHKLWYVLYKERNVLLTETARARRFNMRIKAPQRKTAVRKAMARIKQVLAERRAAYRIAQRDRDNTQDPP
ncbi:hypothetical protein CTAYLR_001490 [Chrysophaeum taylorii]|uniref:Protein kinase domain-containing protein n=1 Tax=Chrysophaeum taylorii TaxID=2483200 RepID=A0AAD7UFF3_9STRA|nr:hypothetical protein CTAYLR_001490 [Chrysophaeum taylorii]